MKGLKSHKRIGGLTRKIVAGLLSIVMMISVLPAFSVVASATEEEKYITFSSEKAFSLSTAKGRISWDGTLYYSYDLIDWSTWDGKTTIQVGANQNLYMCGDGNHEITGLGDLVNYWVIDCEDGVACTGNIEYLLDYDKEINEHPTMNKLCYASMFYGCTSLTIAPSLPATQLAECCYEEMFYGCTSLTTAPSLLATTAAEDCCHSMFYGCTSLKTAPDLPATQLAKNCYNGMFSLCTNLTTVPNLPAKKMEEFCYATMFYGCTNLTTTPSLPATTLADSCYYSMFSHCTNLTTTPSLPATQLAESCYEEMFYGCTSLTIVPDLPATTLPKECYALMFFNCSSIKVNTELTAECTRKWRVTAEQEEYNNWNLYMFGETGGTMNESPNANQTYYTTRLTLKESDFTVALPTDLTYSGTGKTATASAIEGIDCGDINVKYYNEPSELLSETHKDVGTYTVKIDVEQNDNYNALPEFKVGIFTIIPKVLSVAVDDVMIDKGQSIPALSVNVTGWISGEEGNIPSFVKPTAQINGTVDTMDTDLTSISVTYIGGTSTVNYTFDYDNTANITINTVDVSAADFEADKVLTNWQKKDITLLPKGDYSYISTDSITWVPSLSLSTEGGQTSQTFYVKKADGTVSESKTITYKLDKTKPNGDILFNSSSVKKQLETIAFDTEMKDKINVAITSQDSLSGVAKIEYCKSETILTEAQVSALTKWETYTSAFDITTTDQDRFVIYVKVTDNAGNVTYFGSKGVTLEKTRSTLTKDDFLFTKPANLTYDGTSKEATVRAQDGINCGVITVKYYDVNGEMLLEAPKNAGTYTVKIDVVKNEKYNAITGLELGNFVITKAVIKEPTDKPPVIEKVPAISPTAKPVEKRISIKKTKIKKVSPVIYTGYAIRPALKIKFKGKILRKNKDYTIQYKNNKKVGTAKIWIKGKGNYKGSRIIKFMIKRRPKNYYAPGKYVLIETMNLRADHSAESDVIGYLNKGDKVKVLQVYKKKVEMMEYVWLKIKYKRTKAYIYAPYTR